MADGLTDEAFERIRWSEDHWETTASLPWLGGCGKRMPLTEEELAQVPPVDRLQMDTREVELAVPCGTWVHPIADLRTDKRAADGKAGGRVPGGEDTLGRERNPAGGDQPLRGMRRRTAQALQGSPSGFGGPATQISRGATGCYR